MVHVHGAQVQRLVAQTRGLPPEQLYDACYVALAEQLGCALLTADQRLARAPGSRCPITVVPR